MKRPIIIAFGLLGAAAILALALRNTVGSETNPLRLALYPGDVEGQLAVSVFDGGSTVSPWIDADALVDAMQQSPPPAGAHVVLYLQSSPPGSLDTKFKASLEAAGHTVVTDSFTPVPPRPDRGA